MSVLFSTQSNTPIRKREIPYAATTAVAFWNSSTKTKIVLTDYSISVAAAGTVQIKFGRPDSSSVIFEHLLAGSGAITVALQTPFYGDRDNGILYLESGMNGFMVINASGFEI